MLAWKTLSHTINDNTFYVLSAKALKSNKHSEQPFTPINKNSVIKAMNRPSLMHAY